jgi:hypothetical protein
VVGVTRRTKLLCVATVVCGLMGALVNPAQAHSSGSSSAQSLLKGSRLVKQHGWLLVHVQGTPYQIGYQRGYLTAKLTSYWLRAYLGPKGSQGRRMARLIAQRTVWNKIPAEYQAELRGTAAALKAKGYTWDLWDVVAANDWADQGVYGPESIAAIGFHCSAFIATGQATADHRIVMGHDTWSTYDQDFVYNIIFDVHPQKGYAFRYQGAGGAIWSGEDWYVNKAGLMVCETSLDDPVGNPKGIPVFVRVRKAVQYASTIDGFLRLLLRGNNGGYPNQWLVGDAKTGEIASLQLGCWAYNLSRTRNGFFGSSNYAFGSNFRREAQSSSPDPAESGYARYVRWGQLRKQQWGTVDVAVSKAMLTDHYDTYYHKIAPSQRTICGHGEVDPTDGWPEGAYDGKVTTAAMVLNGMQMWARWGHPCGTPFDAALFMKNNPQWVQQSDAFAVEGLKLFQAGTPTPWSLVTGF